MSAPEALAMIHELESYGLIIATADDAEIAEALSELVMVEEGEQ